MLAHRVINSHVVNRSVGADRIPNPEVPRDHGATFVIIVQVRETDGKRAVAGIHAVGVPNVVVHMGSKLPYRIGHAHKAWRQCCLSRDGERSQPWLPQPHASGCKIGHSGCPLHNRCSQNRAIHALQAWVKLAAQGDATDRMSLRTSWGEGYLSVDGTVLADAGCKMQVIQQRAGPLLTDPGSRFGCPARRIGLPCPAHCDIALGCAGPQRVLAKTKGCTRQCWKSLLPSWCS